LRLSVRASQRISIGLGIPIEKVDDGEKEIQTASGLNFARTSDSLLQKESDISSASVLDSQGGKFP
jgi:hypothetical protein